MPGSQPSAETTAAERRVLDALDEAALVETLVELVRVPSVTGTDAESELQHTVARWFEEAGLEVDLWSLDLDDLRADPDFPGTEAPRLEGHGLVGTASGDGEPALVLQGHVDVVPVGDLANWPGAQPFSAHIANGVLHGRGACDMKAGMAVNLAVARALHRSGVRTERRLALHSVVSEEDGGLGAFATLRRGHRGEVAVITEPTSGRLVTANAGALTFRIEVTGRAAHGSTRQEGVSALEAFWPVHLALRELEARRNADPHPLFGDNPLPYGISVGTVHTGDWASSVPDLLVAEGRMGVRAGGGPGPRPRRVRGCRRGGRRCRPLAARPRAPRDLARWAVRLRTAARGARAGRRGGRRRGGGQRAATPGGRRALRLGPAALRRGRRHPDAALRPG